SLVPGVAHQRAERRHLHRVQPQPQRARPQSSETSPDRLRGNDCGSVRRKQSRALSLPGRRGFGRHRRRRHLGALCRAAWRAEQANAAVALIIAPGAAMNELASAGCTARNQARSAPSPAMDARDYLECFDTGTSTFTTTGPTTSFNDQVVRITVADVMPGIEAAIASRAEREIVPLLRGVYATNSWGPNVSAANPVYPFA